MALQLPLGLGADHLVDLLALDVGNLLCLPAHLADRPEAESIKPPLLE